MFTVLAGNISLAAISCSQQPIRPAETPPRVIDGGVSAAEEQSVALKIDQTIEVRLRFQSGTGYAWRIAGGASDTGVVNSQGQRLAHETERGYRPPGSPTRTVFTLRALRPGETTVEFVYERPWEKKVQPVRRFVLHIHVER